MGYFIDIALDIMGYLIDFIFASKFSWLKISLITISVIAILGILAYLILA